MRRLAVDVRGRPVGRTVLALGVDLVLLAGCWALLGLFLIRVADGSALVSGEAELNRQLAASRTPEWNTVTQALTWLAATGTVVIGAAIAIVIVGTRLRRPREAAYVAACVAGEAAAFLLVTLIVDRPRPPVVHLDHAPPTSSFPSGHTAAAIVLYGSLAVLACRHITSRLIRVATVSAAVVIPPLVAVSRLYRGMHFLTDVVAGALLGVGWLVIVTHVLLRRRQLWPPRGRRDTAGTVADAPGELEG